MSTAGKKNAISKPLRAPKIKPVQEIKNIGLDEKILKAKKMHRSLENPEFLK